MMRKIFLLCLGIVFPVVLYGQGQTSNWYFGNGAGIRFENDGTVTALDDGMLETFEGCATISDASGALLFYTDGITVYNSLHEVMENGYGLYGDPSSTQSALIVPKPDDPNIFYLFTVDTATTVRDPDYGLNYSVIDLSLNGGLGEVIQKNTKLLEDCSEKVTAVIRDCFDRSIWVMTLAQEEIGSGLLNTFYAYEVTSGGVNKFPVKSTMPELLIDDPRGYLKFSADGTRLVSANQNSGLYVFDFDVATGAVYNPQKIEIPGDNKNPYGVEFSPNGRWLYVHATNSVALSSTDHSSDLLQFDLQAPDIASSRFVLDQRPIFRGALQQGENGKIYRTIAIDYDTGTPFLGVINDPDEQGMAANYQHNAISLSGMNATQGLPPFIQSFFGGNDLVKNSDGTTSSTVSLCVGDGLTLETEDLPGAVYLWEKDGVPFNVPGGFSYTINNVTDPDGGHYKLEIIPADPSECPIYAESFVKILPTPDPILELNQCDYDIQDPQDGLTEVDLSALDDYPELEFEFYETLADRTNGIPIVDSSNYRNIQPFAQTLYYKSTNTLGCVAYGEIQLTVAAGNISNSGLGPVTSCTLALDGDGQEAYFDMEIIASYFGDLDIRFYASLDDLAEDANRLSGEFRSADNTIYARKENGGQCLGVDLITLQVREVPGLTMETSFPLCQDGSTLTLTGPVGYDTYTWYQTKGSTTKIVSTEQDIAIRELGEYRVEVGIDVGTLGNSSGCIEFLDFAVVASEKAVIETIDIADFSANNTVEIMTSGSGEYQYSIDGETYQDSPRFEDVQPGFQTVYVRDKNGCGITTKDISVLGYPKFFTPNGDGVNDFWQVIGVSDSFQPDAFISIYDRYGSFVTQIRPESAGWNGRSVNRELPASDYWFRVALRDGRIFKGHFSLKR